MTGVQTCALPIWAKELLAEVMTIDNPQVIRSTIQLALKNMGLTRMMNPAAIKPY